MFLRQLALLFVLSVVLCLSSVAQAQITPPGMGEGRAGTWLAAGFKQPFDAERSFESVTYVGVGRKSDPDSFSPFQKMAILVLNEEVYHYFAEHWLSSLAFSARHQNQYQEDAPFGAASPAYRDELRIYGRVGYIARFGGLKWQTTFRPEVRNFFMADMPDTKASLEFRFRVKTQVSVPVGASGLNSVMASAEMLNAVGRAEVGWTTFSYRESRFCLYYSRRSGQFSFDVGYMNDLVGMGSDVEMAHYLAFDVVWDNPLQVD